MAEKLTPEKIEEIAKNFEKIQDKKIPIIKSEKETVKLDYGSLDNLRPDSKPKAPEKRVLTLHCAKSVSEATTPQEVAEPLLVKNLPELPDWEGIGSDTPFAT